MKTELDTMYEDRNGKRYKITQEIDENRSVLRKISEKEIGYTPIIKESLDINNNTIIIKLKEKIEILETSHDELSLINQNIAQRLVKLENMVYQNEENTKTDGSLENTGSNSTDK